MSGHEIPFHIQEEIMKRLPVESLIRFRSVSKIWKSFIDSSQFITAHPRHVLVSCKVPHHVVRIFSYIDDGTFPKQMSVMTVPTSVKQLLAIIVIGSCHGIICAYGLDTSLKHDVAVLWNPLTRTSVAVPVPVFSLPLLAFGVCPVTHDPKLLAITHPFDDKVACKVAVYTLSSREWKIPSTTIPLGYWMPKITTRKFIYLLYKHWAHISIMSFDLTHETFEVIRLPYALFPAPYRADIRMSTIRESLALIISSGITHAVWMMEDDGVSRSFTKLFNIMTLSPNDSIHGFTKNGIPIVLLANGGDDDDDDDDDGPPCLVVYGPNSEHNNVIKIPGSTFVCNVYSYMETQLLSNCNIY